MKKTCSKCNTNKELSSFHKDKRGLLGVRPDCKDCHNKQLSSHRKTPYGRSIRAMYGKRYASLFTPEHKKEIAGYHKKYQETRRKKDIQYSLARKLRCRLYKALRGKEKGGSSVRDLGCTLEELKEHIEKQFKPGMNWENWAFRGWHMDHIAPLARFDLTKREEVIVACHYTNLKPMWWDKNLSKGKKLLKKGKKLLKNI